MKDWQRSLVGPSQTLRDALKAIDATGSHMALVVAEDRRLLGTLSDGDIRRWLIDGGSIDDPAEGVYHTTPVTGSGDDPSERHFSLMRSKGLAQLPLVDADNRVVGMVTLDDYLLAPERRQPVVIMAGGLGTRMGELTKNVPKPMLKIGERPILQTVIEEFRAQGFRNFYLAVNHLADQIVGHFGDGRAFGVSISYLRESSRMGTAGALSLLPHELNEPVVVTNGDILLKENVGLVLEHHIERGAAATLLCRDYQMQVPFGVVTERDGSIADIVEKPIHNFVVNAGVYILSPPVVRLVPPNQFFDMPDLFRTCIAQGLDVLCHRTEGYWLDIGRVPDFERAKRDFGEVFG